MLVPLIPIAYFAAGVAAGALANALMSKKIKEKTIRLVVDEFQNIIKKNWEEIKQQMEQSNSKNFQEIATDICGDEIEDLILRAKEKYEKPKIDWESIDWDRIYRAVELALQIMEKNK